MLVVDILTDPPLFHWARPVPATTAPLWGNMICYEYHQELSQESGPLPVEARAELWLVGTVCFLFYPPRYPLAVWWELHCKNQKQYYPGV